MDMHFNPIQLELPHVVWVDNSYKDSPIVRLAKRILCTLAYPLSSTLPHFLIHKIQPRYKAAVHKEFPEVYSLLNKYGSFQNIQRKIEEGAPIEEFLTSFKDKPVSQAIPIRDICERTALQTIETYLNEIQKIAEKFEKQGMDHHTVGYSICEEIALFKNPRKVIEEFLTFKKNVIPKPLCEWTKEEVDNFEINYFGKIIAFELDKTISIDLKNLPTLYRKFVEAAKSTPEFYRREGMHMHLPCVWRILNSLAEELENGEVDLFNLKDFYNLNNLWQRSLLEELLHPPESPSLKKKFAFLDQLKSKLGTPNEFLQLDKFSIENLKKVLQAIENRSKEVEDLLILIENEELLAVCQKNFKSRKELTEKVEIALSEDLLEKRALAERIGAKDTPRIKLGNNVIEYIKGKNWILRDIFPDSDHKRGTLDKITSRTNNEWDRLTDNELGKILAKNIFGVFFDSKKCNKIDFPLDFLIEKLKEEVNPAHSIIQKIKKQNEDVFSKKLTLEEYRLIQVLKRRGLLSKNAKAAINQWEEKFFSNSKEKFIRVCFFKLPTEELDRGVEENWKQFVNHGSSRVKSILKVRLVSRVVVFMIKQLFLRNLPYGHANFLMGRNGENYKIGIWKKGIYHEKINGSWNKRIEQYAINIDTLMPDQLNESEKGYFTLRFQQRMEAIFRQHEAYKVRYPNLSSLKGTLYRFLRPNAFRTIDPEEVLLKTDDQLRESFCSQFVALALLDATKTAYEATGRKLTSMRPLGFHRGENLDAMHPVKLRNKLLKKKIIHLIPDPRLQVLEVLPN